MRFFLLGMVLLCSCAAAQAQISSDTFTRANASNLGPNWTAESGAISGSPFLISSNSATPSSGTNNAASFWSANSFSNDQWAEAIVNGTSNSSGPAGVVLRASGGDNYYRAVCQPGTSGVNGSFTVGKVVSGVFTDIGGGNNLLTLATGSLIHAEIVGTTITVYINGTLVKTITDSSLSSGSPGIAAYIGGHPVNLTNWRGGNMIWTRQGTVIPTAQANTSGNGTQEPTIAYTTTDCVIVANPCYQIWITDGWTSTNIKYGESSNSTTWSIQATAVMGTTATAHGFVFKSGSTYYALEGNSATAPSAFDLWSSSSPNTGWTKTNTGVLSAVASTWENTVFNPYVWVDGSTWYMLYEGRTSATVYSIGLATSTNSGVTWTKYSGNPVLTNGSGSVSGPEFHIVNGIGYLFTHTSVSSTLPSDVSLYASTDRINWTASPQNPVVERTLSNEGANVAAGQLADSSIVEVSGTTYLFNDATAVQSSGNIHINLRTTPTTLATFLNGTGISNINAAVQAGAFSIGP